MHGPKRSTHGKNSDANGLIRPITMPTSTEKIALIITEKVSVTGGKHTVTISGITKQSSSSATKKMIYIPPFHDMERGFFGKITYKNIIIMFIFLFSSKKQLQKIHNYGILNIMTGVMINNHVDI